MLKKETKEYIDKYCEKFGVFPYFDMMGASDEKIVSLIKDALRTGKEIEIELKPNVLH